MGTPTTRRDSRLSSAALEVSELIEGKGSNRVRAVPFQRIRSSVTRTHLPSGRWRERRHAVNQFAHSPNISSDLSIARELRCPSRRVDVVQLEILLGTPRMPAL
jgi:hypothetical protein